MDAQLKLQIQIARSDLVLWQSSIEIMLAGDGVSSVEAASSLSPSQTSTGRKSTTAKDSDRSRPERNARRH
jgi:hypothetical protein